MNKRVTREDIAKAAGVSVTAVSRAINNSGYVKQEKKDRIIKVARELGYKNTINTLSMHQQKTKQIIFFREDLTGAYFNQMFHGITREAKKKDYRVLLDAQYDFANIKNLLVDGIIFPNDSVAEKYASTVGQNYMLPTVTVAFNMASQFSKSIPEVLLDDRNVINTGIDYLLNMGHRRIGIATPSDSSYAKYRLGFWEERLSFERIENYKNFEILIDSHTDFLGVDDMEFYYNVSNTFEYFDLFHIGELAAEKYMSSKRKASAYLCFNDDMAHGMINRLEKLGVKVPEDVSILGIDGTYIRNHYQKKLSSVATFPERIGADCVNLMINILEKKPYKYINWSKIEILEGDTVKKMNL